MALPDWDKIVAHDHPFHKHLLKYIQDMTLREREHFVFALQICRDPTSNEPLNLPTPKKYAEIIEGTRRPTQNQLDGLAILMFASKTHGEGRKLINEYIDYVRQPRPASAEQESTLDHAERHSESLDDSGRNTPRGIINRGHGRSNFGPGRKPD